MKLRLAHKLPPVPQTEIVTWTSWEELTGEPVEPDVVFAELRQMPREAVTRGLVQLLALVSSSATAEWLGMENETIRREYLTPRLRNTVERIEASEGRRTVLFHRPQLLTAFLLAQRLCSEGDGDIPRIQEGRLLLKVSNLLRSDTNLKEHRLGLAAFLLPHFYETNPADRHLGLIRGAELMRLEAWNRKDGLAHARRVFEETTNLSLMDFWAVLFPLTHRLGTITDLGKVPTIRPGELIAMAPQGAAIGRTLELLSLPFQEYPSRVPEPAAILSSRSFEPVRSHPLIRLPDGAYACVDPAALEERSAACLNWTLRKLLHDGERQHAFIRDWSSLIEEYVNSRMKELLGRTFHSLPKDDQGNEITDGLFEANDDVVLFEIKTATINDETRFGNDPDALALALEKKFLRRSQIGRALERLFGPEKLGKKFFPRLHVPKPFARAWPVLIVTDRGLCLSQIETFLAEELARSMPPTLPRSLRVQPLQVLFLDDVQRLFPLLRRKHNLVNILRARQEMPTFHRTTFHNFLISVYERSGIDQSFEENELDRISDEGLAFWKNQGNQTW